MPVFSVKRFLKFRVAFLQICFSYNNLLEKKFDICLMSIFALMKNLNVLIGIFLALMLTWGCETDFEQNAEWKDVTVVYGLLNQKDSISYIKVNKAFLGDSSALIYASRPDSSLYGSSIEVKLEEYKWGSLQKEYNFDTTTLYDKDSGSFYYPQQPVYYCVTHNQLDEESEYRIRITNKNSGKIISAATPLVHDFTVLKPIYNHPTVPTLTFPDNNSSKSISWYSAVNGKRYEVVMRFNFKEKFFDNPDTLLRTIETRYPGRKSLTDEGGEEMEIQFSNESFYIWLQNSIPYESEKEAMVDVRVPGKIDIVFSVAAAEFNTYLEVNEPSNSIVQDRPEYTNIENGIGIFSSRYSKSRHYYLHPLSQEILVTKGLKFIEVVITTR